MTDKYECPNGCKPDIDTPFYAPATCLPDDCELGVLVYPNLEPSNRWTDGVAGVPAKVIDYWKQEDDCLPYCVACHIEIVNSS